MSPKPSFAGVVTGGGSSSRRLGPSWTRGHMLSVALAATLWSSAALSQAETETEVAPSQPVETVPTAPPAPPRPKSDEPTSASTPPVVAPNTASSSETAPAPLPTGAPTIAPTIGPPESPAVPLPTGAPTSRPIDPPAQALKDSLAAGRKERATTLIVVNGRAVSTTTVAVLVGTKAVARSGPLAPNTRVALKLPKIKACRVSVVASFPGWYSAITRGKIDVCKTGRVLVRL
jgi:hypothetical protein